MAQRRHAVNHEIMHKINRSLVLSSLRKNPSLTRAKLSGYTGLTRSAISYLTDELIRNEFIHEVGFEESSGGRRGIKLELNPDGACAIAVKINASSVQCALANLLGEVLLHRLVPLNSTREAYVLNICDDLIRAAFQKNGGRRPVLGIGAVVTGVIGAAGKVIYSKFMNWKDVDFRADWEQKYGVKVSVDNEVNLATLGENHYGSFGHDSNFIYIEIGHGLGAGIVIDGKLYRGSRGYAGEVGFMTILHDKHDEIVSTKSWQSLVGISSFVSIARRQIAAGAPSSLDSETLTFRRLVNGLRAGDAVAASAMIEMSRYLGLGIANLVNVFDISAFIIGGELGKEFAPFLQQVGKEIDRHVVIKPSSGIDLRISTLLPDAALMGAIAQVFDETLREPSLIIES